MNKSNKRLRDQHCRLIITCKKIIATKKRIQFSVIMDYLQPMQIKKGTVLKSNKWRCEGEGEGGFQSILLTTEESGEQCTVVFE